ncbi:MAG: hypothetical protein ABI685_02390 [Ferruginibacter sp.]
MDFKNSDAGKGNDLTPARPFQAGIIVFLTAFKHLVLFSSGINQ